MKPSAERRAAATSIAWSWRHAITQSGLPATTRHVLLTLSCFMNDTGGDCYPTTRQIADATGLSERAVCTHIASAKEKGWLRVSVRNGRQWKRHEYCADWPGRVTERRSVKPTENGPDTYTQDATENGNHTERGSVDEGDRLQSWLYSDAQSSLNDVQQTSEITAPLIPVSRGSSLNDVQCLTEPNDKNPLNDVQSTSPYTNPIPVQKNRARETAAVSDHVNGRDGLMRKKRQASASTRPQVASSGSVSKADAAIAAAERRRAAEIAKLPKHEREAAWLAAMEEKP